MTAAGTPPSDYRLLVPRDWFRVDLTQERWRRQLKIFVDKESARGRSSAEAARSLWATLRNIAERGVGRGALEFYLRTEASDESTMPASLLISLVPMPPGLTPEPHAFADALTERSADAEVEVIDLPAGRTVRLRTESTMDFHIRMPGDAGYLHLAYSIPLSGTAGPMGDLCDAMSHSLRWI